MCSSLMLHDRTIPATLHSIGQPSATHGVQVLPRLYSPTVPCSSFSLLWAEVSHNSTYLVSLFRADICQSPHRLPRANLPGLKVLSSHAAFQPLPPSVTYLRSQLTVCSPVTTHQPCYTVLLQHCGPQCPCRIPGYRLTHFGLTTLAQLSSTTTPLLILVSGST